MKPRRRLVEGGKVGTTPVVRSTPCGKQGYASRKIAAERAATARRQTGEAIHRYHREGCHCWHVGHRPWWVW